MPDPDWTVEAADRIEQLVETVREKTTGRLVSIARLLVFGLLAAFMGAMALILLLITAIRVLDIAIPRGVWIPYVVLGGILVLVGMLLLSKRTATSET